MNYEDAIEKIYSLLRFGSKPGLDRLKIFLDRLGNPQKDLKFIHIAGTNGKGSTCAYLSSILITEGYTTGLCISPYVICFRERIQVNSKMIPEAELVKLVEYTFPILEALQKENIIITEFEYITVLAFLYFKKCNCDYVVLETGLGGRFDATNVIESPLLSVITSISLDHTAILGDTLEKVAFEKAGIIKNNRPLVFTPQENEVNKTLIDKAKSCNSKVFLSDFSENIKYCINDNFLTFDINDFHIKTKMLGKYQIFNICNVLKSVEVLKNIGVEISNESILKGIEKAFIPARFEIMRDNPLLIIDGAHNPDGMKNLSDSIKFALNGKKLIGIAGMLKDKKIDDSLVYIDKMFDKIFCVEPNSPRKLDSDLMCEKCHIVCDNVYDFKNDYKGAVLGAFKLCDKNTAIVVFGSLYLASEIRNLFYSS